MALQQHRDMAIVRLASDSELMPPPPKRIKRPKNVIDEESYTGAISEIIARDFFPGLLESETQQEYLDALESRDNAWISSAHCRLTRLRTPGRKQGRRGTSIQTPMRIPDTPNSFGNETPKSVISDMTSTSRPLPSVKIDTNMSLDRFQSLYTSEDNESFYKLLDKQNLKRAEKYEWMWRGNKLPSKMMLKQKEVENKLLESRSTLQDDGEQSDRLAIRNEIERPARPDAWKAIPTNQLMFRPEGVEDSIETVAQRAQNESRAAPKGVSYDNTRMPATPLRKDEQCIPPSPSMSAVRDAIAGRRRALDSESGHDGGETPRVNGYAFVDDEQDEASYEPPFIDLGKGEAIKNPFVIKEQERRENLHHRIVDKNSKAKQNSAKLGMTGKVDRTPVPNFPSSPRVGSTGAMTPAAQRLWSRVGHSGGRAQLDSFGVQTAGSVKPIPRARVRWTPSG